MKRDWTAAIEKRDSEAACRACGKGERELRRLGRTLEAAHIMGREHDEAPIIATDAIHELIASAQTDLVNGDKPDLQRLVYSEIWEYVAQQRRVYVVVRPVRIVPLCGPVLDSSTCHYKLDHHDRTFSLLGKLTPEEEAQAVLDAGGLEQVRIRIAPSEYPSKIAAPPLHEGGER